MIPRDTGVGFRDSKSPCRLYRSTEFSPENTSIYIMTVGCGRTLRSIQLLKAGN